MTPLDLSKVNRTFRHMVPPEYPLDAQAQPFPTERHRFNTPVRPDDPNYPLTLVSSRKFDEVQKAVSMSQIFRAQMILTYDCELPSNRFRFVFNKCCHAKTIETIPVIRNLMDDLGEGASLFFEELDGAYYAWIEVDIVGLIYLKSTFP